jgi:hypothetical protein|tara:strand:- start:1581 stop:2060 length:480 start_codon:yes stop_codon:yes gene_type:complete
MKYTYFYFLSLFFLVSSCDRKEENVLIFKYALETDTTEKYVLNIKKNDSIFYFQYRNLNDTGSLYDLNYIVGKEQLKLQSKTFLATEENYNSERFKYNIFEIKDSNIVLRTLVFNENYGLLASIGFGENFIFSKDSITPKIKELTFKKIFRSINNLKVQ